MGVTPSDHIVAGWYVPTGAIASPTLPHITETSVTYESESCAQHPDPARASLVMRCPRVLLDALDIEIGGALRCFVFAQGLDPLGSGDVVASRNVAYFEGEIDGIERARVTGTAYAAVATSATPSTLPDGVSASLVRPGAIEVRNDSDVVASATLSASIPTSGPSTSGTYRGGLVTLATMVQVDGPPVDVLVSGLGWSAAPISRHNPVAAGAPLTAQVTIPSLPPRTSATVLVAASEYRRGSPEGYRLLVTGSDFLAKLARMSIASEPWDFTRLSVRLADQLGPVAAEGGVEIDWYPWRQGYAEPGGVDMVNQNWVRPLDVDSRSGLDIYQRTVAAVGRVALGAAGRVAMSFALTPSRLLTVAGGVATLTADRGWTSEIPSSAVPDQPLGMTSDRVTSRISATWYRPDQTDTTRPPQEMVYALTSARSVRQYGIVDRRIETDQFTTRGDWRLPDFAPQLVIRMNRQLAEQSAPEWYFSAPVTIVPDDLDAVRGLAELIDNATRFGRVIRFVGPMPGDVPREHRIRGGRFGFDGRRWQIELVPEPVTFSGPDSATIADSETRPALTFDTAHGITIDDMRTVGLA